MQDAPAAAVAREPDAAPPQEATPPGQRIVSLDFVRGFAILGIIFVNVWAFALPSIAYMLPTAYGDMSGWNLAAWWVTQVLFEQKFITLFAMMFGIGVLLFTDRLEARGRSPTGLHYRRMLWLLLFGLLHAYLLWYGDILVLYALCGLLLFLFRKLRARTLIVLGLVPIVGGSLLLLAAGGLVTLAPDDVRDEIAEGIVSEQEIQQEIEAYQGSWLQQFQQRLPTVLMMHFFIMPFFIAWHTLGVMLLGMGLYRLGVFSTASTKALGGLTGVGLVVGLSLAVTGAQWNLAEGFRWEFTFFFGSQFNYWGSLFLAGGYLGALILVVRSGWFQWIVHALSAVGRMAFTNYILQTLIATTIFYGHGFGLFGDVERSGLFLIAAAIALVQIPLSVLWLRFFRYGPLEWLWRSLTYGRPAVLRGAALPARPAQS